MPISPRLTPLISAFLLSGCAAVGPNFEAPVAEAPASWTGAPATEHAANESVTLTRPFDPQWWNSFHDAELSNLVRRAAAENSDILVATARLAQSRAQRGVTAADALPSVNVNASATEELLSANGAISLLSGSNPATTSNGLGSTNGAVPTSTKIPAFSLYQTGFDASWELDIWGRVRREIESADASEEASAEVRHAAVLSTVAEVARDYLQLRGVQETLRITRANLASANESAALTRARSSAGLATDLDVAQAQAQVEQTASQIPTLEQQEAQSINQIGLLLALPPESLRAELARAQPVPPVPPVVPLGLPSELAQRRPDIREAEARLHAATADIGVAQANFYPRVTLSGSASLQALQFHNLGSWNSLTYGIGPSITLPIFDGARIARTVELRRGQQQEAAITYHHTVLQAFTEVDNALIAYSREQVRRDHLAAQVVQSDRALALARDRYRQGLADYLVVLTAQRTALQAQQELADSTTTISTNLVALYKALGGGWDKA